MVIVAIILYLFAVFRTYVLLGNTKILQIYIDKCFFQSVLLFLLCVQVCFHTEELLEIYQMNSSALNRDQFTRLSPALIQQLLSKACTETKTEPVSDSLSIAERKSLVLCCLYS